jgi:hypothetical protein
MTATNHALTGAIIVTIISVPVIGLPLAFVSHFVLDSLPHYGAPYGSRDKNMTAVWIIDAITLAILLGLLVFSGNWLVLTGALVAISPDIAWVYRFIVLERFGKLPPKPANKFNQFHSRIQKYEFKKGIFIEIVWTIIFSLVLLNLL